MPQPHNLDYRPEILFEPKPVSGKIPTRQIHEELSETAQSASKQIALSLLQQAVENDQLSDQLEELIDQQAAAFQMTVNRTERPVLSEAVNLFTGSPKETIDWATAKEAFVVAANTLTSVYGFDPVELVFAETSDSTEGPAVTPIFKMDQSGPGGMLDNAGLNGGPSQGCGKFGSQMPSIDGNDTDASATPFGQLFDQFRSITRWTLLYLLWNLLRAFLFEFLASILKSTRLHKVPIAGRPVRKMINWLKRKANEIKNKAVPNLFDPAIDSLDDALSSAEKWDENVGAYTGPIHSGMVCVQAAHEIARTVSTAVVHTAGSRQGTLTPEGDNTVAGKNSRHVTNPKEFNPNAILLSPWYEQMREHLESAKFGLILPLENVTDADIKTSVATLTATTKSRTKFGNRYLNRSATNFRGLM